MKNNYSLVMATTEVLVEALKVNELSDINFNHSQILYMKDLGSDWSYLFGQFQNETDDSIKVIYFATVQDKDNAERDFYLVVKKDSLDSPEILFDQSFDFENLGDEFLELYPELTSEVDVGIKEAN